MVCFWLLRKIKIWVDSGVKGVCPYIYIYIYIYIYKPFKSLPIALYTARDLKLKNSAWCQHCVFVLYRFQKKIYFCLIRHEQTDFSL